MVNFRAKLTTKRNYGKPNQLLTNTANESSESIMRHSKKNATRKLIVKGSEAQMHSEKQMLIGQKQTFSFNPTVINSRQPFNHFYCIRFVWWSSFNNVYDVDMALCDLSS